MIRHITVLLVALTLAGCGGGSSSPTTPAQIPTSVEYATIDGQVLVGSADLNLASPLSKAVSSKAAPDYSIITLADTALASATVCLYKIYADGTEEATGTCTTTDASGNYTFSNVPVTVTGTGALTDFYYEFRATIGDISVTATAALIADGTINITPETKVGSLMQKNVLTAGGEKTLPATSIINQLKNVISYSLYNYGASINSLSTLVSAETYLSYLAAGLSNDSGNAEYAAKAFEFAKQQLGTASSDATSAASYLENVIRRSCLYDDDLVISGEVMDSFADAFVSGVTVTPANIITAYNQNATSAITTASAVDLFADMLAVIDAAFSEGTDLSQGNVIGAYSRLNSSSFTEATPLEMDQGWAFLEAQLTCGGSGFDFVGYTNDLLGTSISYSIQKAGGSSSTGYIADENLYTAQSPSCSEALLAGHVRVYKASGASITSVKIEGASGGSLTLNYDTGADTYPINPNDSGMIRCLSFDAEQTLTIAATFDDSSTDTYIKTITPLDATAATITSPDRYDGETNAPLSAGSQTPTHVTVSRPLLKLDSGDIPASAPEGSRLMYTYEFTCPCDSTAISSPSDKDFVLAPVDSNPSTCGSSSSTCRLHVEPGIYDRGGRIISKGYGTDAYYCKAGTSGCT